MTEEAATVDLTGWPKSLRMIAEMIGPGPALRLFDAYAGQDYVYVPEALTEAHPLVQAVGETAAQLLVKGAGGDRLFVPTMAVRRILMRKRLIRDAEGSTAEIARRFGVSPRWVRYVKSEGKPDPRQLSLFD